jgi:hypothetical protein
MISDPVAFQINAMIDRIHAAKGSLKFSSRTHVHDLGQAFCSYIYGEGWSDNIQFKRDSQADNLPIWLLPKLVAFEREVLNDEIDWLTFTPRADAQKGIE